MTTKQEKFLNLISSGKTVAEICKIMGIQKQSFYNFCHRMKTNGMEMGSVSHKKQQLTPMQRVILTAYMEKELVPEIAKRLNLTCQTVMNHATAGFIRLGLTEKGVDRVAALRSILEPDIKPVTMADPFFGA